MNFYESSKKKYPVCHICLYGVPVITCYNPVHGCPHTPMVPCARVVVALLQNSLPLLVRHNHQPHILVTGACVEQLAFCDRQSGNVHNGTRNRNTIFFVVTAGVCSQQVIGFTRFLYYTKVIFLNRHIVENALATFIQL